MADEVTAVAKLLPADWATGLLRCVLRGFAADPGVFYAEVDRVRCLVTKPSDQRVVGVKDYPPGGFRARYVAPPLDDLVEFAVAV